MAGLLELGDGLLRLFGRGPDDRAQEIIIADGQALLEPLIGLAEWEREVGMPGLDIVAGACASQVYFCSGVWVQITK
jgi:hypothetical protein